MRGLRVSKLLNLLKGKDLIFYQNIENNIQDLQRYLPIYAAYLTDHGPHHSKRIIEIYDRMTPITVMKSINPSEAFILLSSAWLHDIGYLMTRYKGKALRIEQVHGMHHELSRMLINDRYKELGIEDRATADILGRVCYCHRKSVDLKSVLPRETEALKGADVRVQLLASMLSVADALDTDIRRASETFSKYVCDLPPENKKHWEVCQYINGITFLPKSALIRVDCSSNTRKDTDLIKWKLGELSKELDRTYQLLVGNGLSYVKIEGNILRNGKTETVDARLIKDKDNDEVISYDSGIIDLETSYVIKILNPNGDTWIGRNTIFANTTSEPIRERIHTAYSDDSTITWDWTKDIKCDGGSINQISDRPGRKEFKIVFKPPIRRNAVHQYSYNFFWPKMFPQKKEWFIGKDTSTVVIYSVYLPRGTELIDKGCIEKSTDGSEKPCIVIDEKRKLLKNEVCYKITILKEQRTSSTQFYWEIK